MKQENGKSTCWPVGRKGNKITEKESLEISLADDFASLHFTSFVLSGLVLASRLHQRIFRIRSYIPPPPILLYLARFSFQIQKKTTVGIGQNFTFLSTFLRLKLKFYYKAYLISEKKICTDREKIFTSC